MARIRRSNEKEKVLEELSKTKDLRKALELMLGLQGSTIIEIEVVSKYDKKTGEPKEYAWKPYRRFRTDFRLEKYFYDESIKLTDEVTEEIKKGPVCFDKDNKRYVAKFKTKHIDESDRDGNYRDIKHAIYLSEVRIL